MQCETCDQVTIDKLCCTECDESSVCKYCYECWNGCENQEGKVTPQD